jgi:hypothetical protein
MAQLRISGKRIGVLFLSIIIAMVGVFLYIIACNKPPKEKNLVEAFYAHRVAYERLRDMILEDGPVRAVYARFGVETTKSGLPHPPLEVNFPVNRYNEYLALLEQIGSADVFRAGENDSEICIAVWASGFGGDTRHVDTCWLDSPPANQITGLDAFYKTPKPRHPAFKHIDGNWYLWADW